MYLPMDPDASFKFYRRLRPNVKKNNGPRHALQMSGKVNSNVFNNGPDITRPLEVIPVLGRKYLITMDP